MDQLQSLTEALTLDHTSYYIVDLYLLQDHRYTLVSEDIRLETHDGYFRLLDFSASHLICELACDKVGMQMMMYYIFVQSETFKCCLSFDDITSAQHFLHWWLG